MKIARYLSLGAILLIPNFAGAELPMTNDAFGKIEGLLDFCAKATPQNAEKFKESRKQLAKGASEYEVNEARKTPEYKEAYTFMTDELAKVPNAKAVEACSTFPEQAK